MIMSSTIQQQNFDYTCTSMSDAVAFTSEKIKTIDEKTNMIINCIYQENNKFTLQRKLKPSIKVKIKGGGKADPATKPSLGIPLVPKIKLIVTNAMPKEEMSNLISKLNEHGIKINKSQRQVVPGYYASGSSV